MTRHVSRINSHFPSRVLQKPGAGKAHNATTDDCDFSWRHAERLTNGQRGGTPGEADATASVTVVVDDGLFVEFFAFHTEAGGPERTVADNDTDDVIHRDSWRSPRFPGIRPRILCDSRPERGAGAERRRERTGAHGLQQVAPPIYHFFLHRSCPSPVEPAKGSWLSIK